MRTIRQWCCIRRENPNEFARHVHFCSCNPYADPGQFKNRERPGHQFWPGFTPGLRTRSNFVRVQSILASSTKISFFEFRQMNIQNRDNFFTAGAYAIKKIKIFRSCGRFKTIFQLFSAIEIVSDAVKIEQ